MICDGLNGSLGGTVYIALGGTKRQNNQILLAHCAANDVMFKINPIDKDQITLSDLSEGTMTHNDPPVTRESSILIRGDT